MFHSTGTLSFPRGGPLHFPGDTGTSLVVAGLWGHSWPWSTDSDGGERAAARQLSVFSLQVTTALSKLFQGLECSNN